MVGVLWSILTYGNDEVWNVNDEDKLWWEM